MPTCIDNTGASFILVYTADGRGSENQMDGSLSREVYISSNYGTRITDISFLEFFSLSNSPKKGDHL